MDWRELILAVAVRGVDTLVPRLAARQSRAPAPLPVARPGVSILIPERGTPKLLAACLASVRAACVSIIEPVEVHVVANGCGRSDYDALTAQYGLVKWHFEPRSLGFNSAIARGLQFVAHDWVYLLNSDMTVAPNALSALLKLRDERTFAVASQIFLADPNRRREETGWTDYWIEQYVAQHYDRTPEGMAVRGHLYASGGASLFRVALLRRYVASTASYAPFYFEDADWGVQAARSGYAVKFCPASTVAHVHRATIAKYYAPAEIARIVRRNQLLFEARHGFGGRARMLGGEHPTTRRELTGITTLAGIVMQRWLTGRSRARGYAPEQSCLTFFPRTFRAKQPIVLVIAESVLPNHWEDRAKDALTQAHRTASGANVVLITTEMPGVDAICDEPLSLCAAVHVVGTAAPSARVAAGSNNESTIVRQLAWWQRVYDEFMIGQPLSARHAAARIRFPVFGTRTSRR